MLPPRTLVRRISALRDRVAGQLVAMVVLVALLSGGFVGVVAIEQARTVLRDQIFSSSLAAADLAAGVAEAYVSDAESDSRDLAASAELRAAVAAADWNTVTSILEEWAPQHPNLSGVGFIDEGGVLRATSYVDKSAVGATTALDQEWFRNAQLTGAPFLGTPSLGSVTKQPRVPYAVPVRGRSGEYGILIASVSLEGLSDTLTRVQVGDNARTVLSDTTRNIILAHPDKSRILQPGSGKNEATVRLAAGERGAMQTATSYGDTSLAAYEPIQGLPWGIMILQPTQEAFGPLDTMATDIARAIGGALAVSAGAGIAIALGIVRPVRKLRDAVERMAQGDLSARVGPAGGNELGELGRGFDGMADQLQRTLTDLREDDSRFRGLIDAAFDGFTIHERDTILEVGEAFAKMFGYEPAELIGRSLLELVAPESRQTLIDVLCASQRTAEVVGVRNDRSRFHFELVESECRFEGRSAFAMAVRDVTERKGAEAERIRLAAIVSTSNEAIVRTDSDGLVTDWNGGAERLYGYSAQEMVDQNIQILVAPEAAAPGAELLARLHRGEQVSNFETVRVRKDASRVNVSISLSPLYDADGRYCGVASVAHDITERKRAESALMESEWRYRQLVEMSPQAIVVLDGQSILYANAAAARLVGADAPSGLLNAPLESLVHPDDHDAMSAWLKAIVGYKASAEPVEVRIVRRDGEVREAEVIAIPTSFEGRLAFQAIVSDISDRKFAERQAKALAQAEKLRALGQMASGIAHDLNQSLMLIASYGDLATRALDREQPDRDEMRELITTATQAALDGGEAVKRLLLFTRQVAEKDGQPVDLAALVRDVAQMTAPRWRDTPQVEGRPISLHVEASAQPIVIGSAGRLREALTNLVFNAVDALPHGGVIRMTVKEQGSNAVVEVSDSGIGMSPDVLARIFEPFYTTKGGSGTGLGLSMVFGIIEQHGGHIHVESKIGEGTTLRVTLPIAERAALVAVPPVEAVKSSGHALRVLAVDDEPAMTKAVARMLRPTGHIVQEASSGEEALQKLREGVFDVVVSDMGMGPGMNGWELAAAVKQCWPTIRFMLATGWGAAIDPAEALRQGVEVVLAKPYRPIDLERALAAAPDLAA